MLVIPSPGLGTLCAEAAGSCGPRGGCRAWDRRAGVRSRVPPVPARDRLCRTELAEAVPGAHGPGPPDGWPGGRRAGAGHWCGRAAGPFRHAVFQAALDAGVPVRPVAVALRCGGTVAYEAAFVGEQPLLDSVRRVLRVPALVCELTLLPSLDPVGTRAQLASRAGAAIGRATGVPHPTRQAASRTARGQAGDRRPGRRTGPVRVLACGFRVPCFGDGRSTRAPGPTRSS